MTALRDFGLGKHSLEERIQDEAIALVHQFRSKGGKPFDPNHDLSLTVSNIICSINFGKRYRFQESYTIWLEIVEFHPNQNTVFVHSSDFKTYSKSIEWWNLKNRLSSLNKRINENNCIGSILLFVVQLIIAFPYSSRYNYDDPAFKRVLDRIEVLFKQNFAGHPTNSSPWMRHLKYISKIVSPLWNISHRH